MVPPVQEGVPPLTDNPEITLDDVVNLAPGYEQTAQAAPMEVPQMSEGVPQPTNYLKDDLAVTGNPTVDSLVTDGRDMLVGMGKSALMGLLTGSGRGSMPMPTPPPLPTPQPIQAAGPVMFNIKKKKEKKV